MPELSRFYGVIIKIQYEDHCPPHVHVWYGGRERARMRISDTSLMSGSLPRVHLAAVILWMDLHKTELSRAWEATLKGHRPSKIAPLPY